MQGEIEDMANELERKQNDMAMKQFEGMSGDIAGFQLQVSELVMLILLVVTERMLAL